ncbi:MAG: 3D domain-containing protein [Spirochaetes bacterium]|nr:3D domain-containing protein [Spirochaetota bacterium]
MTKTNNGVGIMVALTIVALHACIILFFATMETGSSEHGTADNTWTHLRGCTLTGFTITAYCPGSCCNGKWKGKTAHGIDLDVFEALGISVAAVDPAVIPLGSVIQYNGRLYFAADTGGLIKGKRIDLLLEKHDDTVRFGVRHHQSVKIHSVDAAGTTENICSEKAGNRAI